MKKISFKIYIVFILIFASFFLLFFISNTKVSAQTQNEIVINTTGYSMLSANSFIFGGSYSGNFDKKAITTYFQYKKGDNNLDSEAEETIKIDRSIKFSPDPKEFDVFYTSPELSLFSTYYFRAVGYLNDDSNNKFYGETLTIKTGDIPSGYTIPFTSGEYKIEACIPPKTLNSEGICEDTDASVCGEGSFFRIKGVCLTKTEPPCLLDTTPFQGSCVAVDPPKCDPGYFVNKDNKCEKIVDNSGGNSGGSGFSDLGGDAPVTRTGLVPCENNCTFNHIFTLINTVIDYFIVYIAVPLAAIMFAYAGFEMITSGGETSKREKAKKIFLNVSVGIIIVLASFLIVKTVLTIVGYNQAWDWFGF